MAVAIALLLLSGCVTRPPGTDIFGRPLTPADHQEQDAATTGAGDTGGAGDAASHSVDIPEYGEMRPPSAAPWSPTPVVTDARIVEQRSYVVAAGDTLRGIGNRTGAGSEAIAIANALVPPYIIQPSQRLRIPGGRYHEVRAGQSGIAIARAYGVDWTQVVSDNALAPPYLLRVGQALRLPPGPAAGREMTPEERASVFTLDIDDIVTGGTRATPANTPAARPPASAPTRFAWPLEGRVLSRFGPAATGRVNDGIDIAAPVGSPVRATADGLVAYTGNEIGPLGGLVLIDHGGGWVSAYGNLSRVAVASGARVTAGSVIATSGDSGQVEQPQLHFELRRNRLPVDPLRQLPAR